MDRLWAKVEITGFCWLWTGATDSHGYGKFKLDRRDRGAHRLVYEILVGPIPPGLQMDHLCRVRRCVNPDHLDVVTNRDNALRGWGFAAANATKTHCSKGHPFDVINTRVRINGGRQCRACDREVKRRAYARRKTATGGDGDE